MNGFSFHPSAIAANTTVNRPLSWPVERTGTDLSPVWVTVVSPGISSQSGVSSMFPIWASGYCLFIRRRLVLIMNEATLGSKSLGSL